jgi:hypothetical protein
MKQVGILILASVIACAAAPGGTPRHDGVALATSKSIGEFGGCFVNAQDRASLAWSYVPKADGGTFSNLGARDARSPYFLAVSDRGSVREVRLEAANATAAIDARVTKAVNECV